MSLSNHKKDKRRTNIASLFIVVFLSILFLTSSTEAELLAKKSDSRKSLTGSDRKKKKKYDESMTNLALLPLVTAFADNYDVRMTQSSVMLQKGLKNNPDRLAAFNIMIQSIQAAYNISIKPNSAIAILDMTVMVTLSSILHDTFSCGIRHGLLDSHRSGSARWRLFSCQQAAMIEISESMHTKADLMKESL